jgi:hypothetical protein
LLPLKCEIIFVAIVGGARNQKKQRTDTKKGCKED